MDKTLEITEIDEPTFDNFCHWLYPGDSFSLCGMPIMELAKFHPDDTPKSCRNPVGHNPCPKCVTKLKGG